MPELWLLKGLWHPIRDAAMKRPGSRGYHFAVAPLNPRLQIFEPSGFKRWPFDYPLKTAKSSKMRHNPVFMRMPAYSKAAMLMGLKMAVLALVVMLPAANAAPAATRESAATLVIYNNLDPASVTLAAYYAKRRAIPLDHTVGLNCATTEEITRAQYDETIAGPLRQIFADRGWWHAPADPGEPVADNQIRFVALMRGIPLKIASVANYPGDSFTGKQQALNTNAAAVDSELSALGVRTRKISGPLRNLYYRSYTPFMDMDLAPMMLVCRLDGPTVTTVRSMIDGALAVERGGLNGFAYIDMRGITSGPMVEGDRWLDAAAGTLRQYGMPLISDTLPSLIPADYPMDHAAIYLGWYSGAVEGPMARDDFRFEPGAIAVHIHSFSASTLRDPRAGWAGPLLTHGAAATIGNVYEPYLDLTPHLDVLADRLRNGFNFAESAYACEPVLSWMTTFVGDPLYRPFPDAGQPPPPVGVRPAIEFAAYRAGTRLWFEKGRAAGEKQLEASARELQSGIVWEGLGLLQRSIPDNDAALASFRQAQECYGISEEGLRTVLHQIEIFNAVNKPAQARALAAKALEKYTGLHGTELLRAVIGLPPASPGRWR